MSWYCEPCSHIITNGSMITLSQCDDHISYTPINALFKPLSGGIVNGKHFFEFRFGMCKNGAFVGVTDEEHFKSGYKLKAFLYGGNLSDGSHLLVANFGDHIIENDKVGVLLELEDNRLKIHYFHNDKPLGLAFYVKNANLKPLFPVVQLFHSTELSINKHRLFPRELERPLTRYYGMEGNWKMERCDHNGILMPHFNNNWRKFFLKIMSDNSGKGDTFNLMFKLGNTMFAVLKYDTGKWFLRPGLSTLIRFPDEIAIAENYMHQFFENFDNVELIGQSLVFTANYNQKIVYKRYNANTPQSVTVNPLK